MRAGIQSASAVCLRCTRSGPGQARPIPQDRASQDQKKTPGGFVFGLVTVLFSTGEAVQATQNQKNKCEPREQKKYSEPVKHNAIGRTSQGQASRTSQG